MSVVAAALLAACGVGVGVALGWWLATERHDDSGGEAGER